MIFHQNISISNCDADYGGGMVLRDSHVQPTASNAKLDIHDSYATEDGGNAFITGHSSLRLLETDYGSTGKNGGCITVSDSGSTILRDINVHNCTSVERGGGIRVQSSHASLHSVSIMDCTSQYGGGMSIMNSTVAHFDMIVTQNNASSGGGIAFSAYSSFYPSVAESEAIVTQNWVEDNGASEPAITAAPRIAYLDGGLAFN